MARPSSELDVYRGRLTQLLDELNHVHSTLAIVEGAGSDDSARQAFFQSFFTNTPDYDVSAAEFFASVVKLRELKTWLETAANRTALAKLRQ